MEQVDICDGCLHDNLILIYTRLRFKFVEQIWPFSVPRKTLA
jgi:hypothetical protein